MNKLLIKQATMSSNEIASLVEKRHDNVKRTIETLVKRGVITSPQIEEKPTDGRPVAEYIFSGEQGKRDSIIVVAQLSPEFTARLVDRWQELENGVIKLPVNYIEALECLVESEKQKELLNQELAIAKPAVEFVEKYVNAEGNMTFRQVAKILDIKEPALKLFLIEQGIIYYTNKTMTPYQKHVDVGRFIVKTGVNEYSDHAYSQMKFTPKGVEWVARLWNDKDLEVVA